MNNMACKIKHLGKQVKIVALQVTVKGIFY